MLGKWASRPVVEAESRDTCKCGTNEHLCTIGISPIYEISGKLAWVVQCFECRETYYTDDEGRDALFGTGWRDKGGSDDQ